MALIRQILVNGLITKDIETYGVLKLSDKGKAFLKKPSSFMMTEDHDYGSANSNTILTGTKTSTVADETLVAMLKDLRKAVAKKMEVPPFVVFQDPSLEDMALKYPVNLEELATVHGVRDRKSTRLNSSHVRISY